MDALAYIEAKTKSRRQPFYVLFGDEDFLKRQCREKIVANILDGADPEFAVASYSGIDLDFSTIRNELDTLPFLAPVRIVIVEQADAFVTEHRASLEKYAGSPSKVGVLILEAKTFPETTNLAKALTDSCKMSCKSPAALKLADWCSRWCTTAHNKNLSKDAAQFLIDLVGPQMGLLDRELAKLAIAIGPKASIEEKDIEAYVGRSKAADVFRILNAIGEGKPAEAFQVLSELLEDGDEPIAILGPLNYQLRRLANVGRELKRGQTLGTAMDNAGIPKWPQARQSMELQIRHLGRKRLEQLPEWMIEISLGLRGGSPLPPRIQLERLLTRLARPREITAAEKK